MSLLTKRLLAVSFYQDLVPFGVRQLNSIPISLLGVRLFAAPLGQEPRPRSAFADRTALLMDLLAVRLLRRQSAPSLVPFGFRQLNSA